MQKISPDDASSKSADLIAGNIEQLKALFPEVVTESKINFDVLKQVLGGMVEDREEKYGLNWPGKRKARQLALMPSIGTLRPATKESVDWDSTQNLMIEGDNLEVLKLLQKSYAGKVKLIYIDPPYNTGNDFVYPDDFADNIKNYQMLAGLIDSDGRKVSSNADSSGRFHSAWLSMMYPRLKLARDFLRADGAIFVSCDESEHPRLRLLMDDVFGQENFVADLVWAAGRKNDSRLISVSHEYIVCYARDAGHLRTAKIEWRQRKRGLEGIYEEYDRLKAKLRSDYKAMTEGMKAWFRELPDSHPAKAHKHYCHVDQRGVYFPDNISWPGGGGPKYEVLHPKTKQPVKVPSRGWMTSDPEKMRAWIADDRVHFGEDENSVPCIKSYLADREFTAPYSVFYQDGRAATKRLRELMGTDCFDFPKDEVVLQELVAMMTSGSDLILDFFAGSATMGHSVMAQNSVDGQQRRFILVQLPEPLDPDNEVQAAAAALCDQLGRPRNIAELAKERLLRVGKKLVGEKPLIKGDTGYRVFKLDSSNIRAWDADPDDLTGTLNANIEHLKPERTEQDVLYELLLKLGLDLTVPIEKKKIGGTDVHAIGAGSLIVCLAKKVKRDDVEDLAQRIIDWHKKLAPVGETTLVFRDSGFEDDVAKSNLAAILVQHGFDEARIRSL